MPKIFFRGALSWLASQSFFKLILLIITSGLSLAALILPLSIRPSSYPLRIGDVAPQDILAPTTLTYTSQILTDQARIDIGRSVAPIFLPPDPAIARRQIEKLRLSIQYIATIRADGYASDEQKIADLFAMEYLQLDRENLIQILSYRETQWEAIQQEAMRVLEQVMRNTTREDQLEEVKRNIPSMISFSLPSDQATIISTIVSQFVVPNSLFSQEQTDIARDKAQQSVTPIQKTFIAGQTIVRRGQIISPVDLEALNKFGLVQLKGETENYIPSITLIALIFVSVGLYFARIRTAPNVDLKSLVLIALTFLLFLFGARLVIPNRTIIPYLYPLSAFGLTIAVLFSAELGFVLSLSLGILVAYGMSNSLDLTIYYILSSFCGVLTVNKGRRIGNFFWSGIAVGCAGSAVILAYRLPDAFTDWFGIATLVGTSFLNGLASASLTLILQFLFSQLLGMTTALQLLEISRPDHPLLQYILRNAPGTYQHSLQVANLAEQAAEAIGVDGLLVRVGAIYHDAGKASNPLFFIENQLPGTLNAHDDLDPESSSMTIIRHVEDGVRLARKYRLPPRIIDFICEHHGTMVTRYQYAKARQIAGEDVTKVDIESYRYPGPKPNSRETALLMLADGCEARARAELPTDDIELTFLVKSVIDYCQQEGQLDNTSLTLSDLNTITKSFVNILRNTHHPRLQYPEITPKTMPVSRKSN